MTILGNGVACINGFASTLILLLVTPIHNPPPISKNKTRRRIQAARLLKSSKKAFARPVIVHPAAAKTCSGNLLHS